MSAAALSLLALATPAIASAEGEERPLVLLVSMERCCAAEAWPDAEKAVVTELEALRLRVRVVDGANGHDGGKELEQKARELGAVCAVRIARDSGQEPGGAEIWIADRVTDKTTFRRIAIEDGGGATAAAIAALRAVEALRASLLEIRIKRTSPGEVAPTPELREIADEVQVDDPVEQPVPPHRFGLGVGAGPIGSPGGVGATGAIAVIAAWHALEHLSVEIDGVFGVLGQDLAAAGASATFDYAAARAWASWDPRGQGMLRPLVGLGAGALFSWTRGADSEGYSGRTDRAAVAFLGGTVQLGMVLARAFWLRLGARVGVLLPEVEVRFADEQVASFGMPLIEGFLLAEVRFL